MKNKMMVNKPKKIINKNIFYMDTETFIYNGLHHPYAFGYISPENVRHLYYIDGDVNGDNLNDKSINLIHNAFTELLKLYCTKKLKTREKKIIDLKKVNFTVFFHNLDFDGIFILSYFVKSNLFIEWVNKEYEMKYKIKIKPLIRNNKIISISIVLSKNLKSFNLFTFKDSYKILPQSLDKLGRSFLNRGKIDFDHDRVNLEWIKNKENKEMCLNYLKNDCVMLKEIFEKAQSIFIKKFHVDISLKMSLPSITLDVFKTCFLEKEIDESAKIVGCYNELICQISENCESFIRKSYKGGRVDVFKPRFCSEKDFIYSYDVNSLYPYCMMSDLPVGEPYFKKDVDLNDIKSYLGFVMVLIECPINCVPVLPIKVKFSQSERLITPVGEFKDIFYTEEILFAIENGYIIKEIYHGYLFKEKYPIFKNFVSELYKERNLAKLNNDEVQNQIYKLLLNSLYGRLGMRTDLPSTFILSTEDADLICSYCCYESREDIGNNYSIVCVNNNNEHQMLKNDDINIDDISKISEILDRTKDQERIGNVSTAIHLAAAITSKARIELNKMVVKNNVDLYYCDTDSIFVNKKLDEIYVNNNEIGKWKFENKIKDAVFLNPKTYGYINDKDKITVKAKGAMLKELNYDYLIESYNSDKEKDKLTEKVEINFPILRFLNQMEIRQGVKNFTKFVTKTEKRIKIYKENKWIDTKPYTIKFNKSDQKNLIHEWEEII